MNVLDLGGARHFCQGFSATAGPPSASLREYVRHHLGRKGQFLEGTIGFTGLRDCLLRDAERCLLLSLSHYRRALDLLTPVASPWAAVTLYYGSYFSARSILGVFGAAIDPPNWLLEIAAANPGSQRLVIRPLSRYSQSPHNYTGTHRVFWDHFYEAGSQIQPWCPQGMDSPLFPVNKSIVWQIDTRNNINYDTFIAVDAAAAFSQSFSGGNLPGSLRGPLATQFKTTKETIELALWVWNEVSLATDALAVFSSGGLKDVAEHLIRDAEAPFNHLRPLFAVDPAGVRRLT